MLIPPLYIEATIRTEEPVEEPVEEPKFRRPIVPLFDVPEQVGHSGIEEAGIVPFMQRVPKRSLFAVMAVGMYVATSNYNLPHTPMPK